MPHSGETAEAVTYVCSFPRLGGGPGRFRKTDGQDLLSSSLIVASVILVLFLQYCTSRVSASTRTNEECNYALERKSPKTLQLCHSVRSSNPERGTQDAKTARLVTER